MGIGNPIEDAGEIGHAAAQPGSCASHGAADAYPPVGFDPSRGDVILTKDVFDFLMGAAPYDGVWFHELNANLPGRFWWRAILRSAQLGTASTMSARSAETEGLSPQDASAVPKADAQTLSPNSTQDTQS